MLLPRNRFRSTGDVVRVWFALEMPRNVPLDSDVSGHIVGQRRVKTIERGAFAEGRLEVLSEDRCCIG